jgi:hypothetical protein
MHRPDEVVQLRRREASLVISGALRDLGALGVDPYSFEQLRLAPA